MKRFLKGGAAAIALTFVMSATAQAQIDRTYDAAGQILINAGSQVTAPPSCIAGYNLTAFNFSECSGAWAGNNSGQAAPAESAVLSYINAVWGVNTASGTGIDLGSAPVLSGDFVLAVKGGPEFSLFYFQGYSGTNFDYATAMAGVSLNKQGNARGVSHVTMYGGTIEVPEPASLLLLGTGLLGVALIRRREDEEV